MPWTQAGMVAFSVQDGGTTERAGPWQAGWQASRRTDGRTDRRSGKQELQKEGWRVQAAMFGAPCS